MSTSEKWGILGLHEALTENLSRRARECLRGAWKQATGKVQVPTGKHPPGPRYL